VSVALYFDNHVPAAITRTLLARGVDVLTAQADGRAQLDDPLLLDRAQALERVLFTRDEDFLVEAAARQRVGLAFAGIIYAHQLRVTIGQCVHDLELIAKCCAPADLANRVEHLPLR
jgi:predicted nuclease of predicted toxin-antitoxin system